MKKTLHYLLTIIASVFLLHSSSLFAQSAPNIVSDIPWDSDPITAGNQSSASTLLKIEAAYNNARRQEETQKGLPAATLGNLVLPTDWNTRTLHQKTLFLINAERSIRGGIDYDGAGGTAPVLGLSVEQVESTLNDVAQSHADWLVQFNQFTHTGINSTTPFQRVQAAFPQNTCSEFLSRSENIAFFTTTSATVTAAIEKAIYNWIYNDSGSAWGHREATLLQDIDLTNSSSSGFKNNYGSALSEGMIGIAIGGANNNTYNPFNLTGMNRSEVVVLVVIDPVPAATATNNACSFQSATALPIELMTFTVKQEGEAAILRWQTAAERNNSHFVIERASNGKEFEPIAEVKGEGNSITPRSYRYADEKLPTGIHYYRLIQYDNGGLATPTHLVALRYFERLNFTIYTNVYDLQLAFNSVRNASGKLTLTNMQGITLQQRDIDVDSGFNRMNFDMQDLPEGMYLMALEINGVTEITKVAWVNKL